MLDQSRTNLLLKKLDPRQVGLSQTNRPPKKEYHNKCVQKLHIMHNNIYQHLGFALHASQPVKQETFDIFSGEEGA